MFIRITACRLADPLSGLLHQGLRAFHCSVILNPCLSSQSKALYRGHEGNEEFAPLFWTQTKAILRILSILSNVCPPVLESRQSPSVASVQSVVSLPPLRRLGLCVEIASPRPLFHSINQEQFVADPLE